MIFVEKLRKGRSKTVCIFHPSHMIQEKFLNIGQKQIKIDEALIEDFQPEVIINPSQVNIEAFIECYLRMVSDYQYLSENGIYL